MRSGKTGFTDRTLAVGHLHALVCMVHGGSIAEARGRHGLNKHWVGGTGETHGKDGRGIGDG